MSEISDTAQSLIDWLIDASREAERIPMQEYQDYQNKACEDMIDYISALEAENAALKEDADIVKHCGFEIITEPETGKYPARKVLRGRDHIHVPVFPEVQE